MNLNKLSLILISFLFVTTSFSQVVTTAPNLLDVAFLDNSYKTISCFSINSRNVIMDTTYHRNGKIKSLMERNTLWQPNGIYREYDSTGAIIISGKYLAKDSAKCLNCFYKEYEDKWKRINRLRVYEFKTGIWSTYHSNGHLKSIGEYDSIFSFYSGCYEPKETNQVIPVYQHNEQLKEGVWKYYNEFGELYLEEEYYNGSLHFKRNFFVREDSNKQISPSTFTGKVISEKVLMVPAGIVDRIENPERNTIQYESLGSNPYLVLEIETEHKSLVRIIIECQTYYDQFQSKSLLGKKMTFRGDNIFHLNKFISSEIHKFQPYDYWIGTSIEKIELH